MKNIILTDEQYNNLMNSNSLEEIKSLLSQNNENDDISSKNLVSIRILSKNEFNNYIKNGALDGSVIIYDDNVWHTSAMEKQSFWISTAAISDAYWNARITGYPPPSSSLSHGLIVNFNQGGWEYTASVDFIIISEMLFCFKSHLTTIESIDKT